MNDDGVGARGVARRAVASLLCFAGAFTIAALSHASEVTTLTMPQADEEVYKRLAESGTIMVVPPSAESLLHHIPFQIIAAVVVLLMLSAFFSGSETAFFSITRMRLRSLKEDPTLAGTLIARTMEHPGRLLTTILIGNMIVNTLTGVLLGTRAEDFFVASLPTFHPAIGYALAVASVTGVLVFFGEIAPKVFAVRAPEQSARLAVIPLLAVDRLLAPVRDGLLGITNLMFKVTRFHEFRAAPFITDEEFKSALTDGEAQGVIEEDERQMIQGILEFSDAQLREILVPRPDIIALPEETTVGEALLCYREHQYSRMPVYRESMDKIIGTLVAKDLLPCIARGEEERKIQGLIRPAHFVPATMTVQQFVRDAQRRRTHIAVVVDEYGGTAGIVTLEDAMEQVVGDIMDEGEHDEPGYRKVDGDAYAVDGDLSLDDLNAVLGTALHDEEHETIAGFVMHRCEKIPEPGDQVEYEGVLFVVEKCDGKRVERVRVNVLPKPDDGVESAAAADGQPS